ncbi:MAG: signal peptide peptidase SppA [Gemmatimonadota bacterium]|nr:MAG: signal peptide peptidase SppA [Gemmatimonadota bacterium]
MEAKKKSPRNWWVALVVAGVIVVFGVGLLLVVYTSAPRDGVSVLARDRVAILPLRGVITQEHLVLSQLKDYRDDRSVRGFVLWIDSPGGEVAPSQEIHRELLRLREDGYPIVAAIGSVGASGAYYAALGADTVLAMPGSLVGSIGVLMEFPVAEELLDKVGVQFEVIKSAEHKDLGSPYRPLTDSDRLLLQQVVDDAFDQFVGAIVEARALPYDSVIQVADGRLLTGRLAIEYGLIDGEGDLADAIEMAGQMAGLGPEPRTVLREARRVTWFDLLTSMVHWVGAGGVNGGPLTDALAPGLLERGPRLLYLLNSRSR